MAGRLLVGLLLVMQTAFTLAEKPVLLCTFGGYESQVREGLPKFSINEIPVEKCTDIVYSNVGVSHDRVSPLNYQFDVEENGYGRFTELARQQLGVRALLGLGGRAGNGRLSETLRSPYRRAKLATSIRDYVNKYNFDGVVLDWGFTEEEDRRNLANFVDELRKVFNREQRPLEIVTSLPVISSQLRGYDVAQLSNKSDIIVAKAFDLHSNERFADVPAPLEARPFDHGEYKDLNIRDGLSLLEKLGARRNKTVLALASYGRTFELKEPATTAAIGDEAELAGRGFGGYGGYGGDFGGFGRRDYLALYEICKKLRDEPNYIKETDEIGKAAYAIRGTEFIGYDNQATIDAKVKFIRDEGLRGAFIKDIELDDYMGECEAGRYPLTSTVQRGLQGYNVPRPKYNHNRPPRATEEGAIGSLQSQRRQDDGGRGQGERPRGQEEHARGQEERARDQEERPRGQEERPRDQEERPREQEERPRGQEERLRDQEERLRGLEQCPRGQEERPRDQEERAAGEGTGAARQWEGNMPGGRR